MFTLAGIVALRELYAPPERFLDPSLSPLFARFHRVAAAAAPGRQHRNAARRVRPHRGKRAHADGVAVEFEIWDRLPHVFQIFRDLPQAAQAIDSIVRFVGERAGWTT